jgi:hypothetical protein
MRIFRQRSEDFDPSKVDPQEAQDRLSASLDVAAAAPAFEDDLPIWPSGIARFSNGILEVTTGEGLRVAARDIQEIYIKPPRAGRLTLKVKFRAGLGWRKHGYWVEGQHEAALHALVATVIAAAA